MDHCLRRRASLALLVLGLILPLLTGCGRPRRTSAQAAGAAKAAPRDTAAADGYRRMQLATVTVWAGRTGRPPKAGVPRTVSGPLEGIAPDPEIAASTNIWPEVASARSSYAADYGAGVVFGDARTVLTSARLVRGARSITLFTLPKRQGVPGKVAVVDNTTGLALVKADKPLAPAPPQPAREVRLGDLVVLGGSPGALLPSLAWRHVAALDRGLLESPGLPALQLETTLPLGFEGGPAFDSSGELVGIVLNWPVTIAPSQHLPGHTEGAGLAAAYGEGVPFVIPILSDSVWNRLTSLAQSP